MIIAVVYLVYLGGQDSDNESMYKVGVYLLGLHCCLSSPSLTVFTPGMLSTWSVPSVRVDASTDPAWP